jgi:hypothetical protein|tara:strand:- start:50 stop:652 length:603 start_codon:yes stop_codon:yes gene_type:complete
MSTLETNLVQPSSGTTLTLGASGDTVDVPSGATFDATGATVTGITQGITEADQWRLTSDFTTSGATISSGWERDDTNGSTYIGTGMSESSGIFTFPSTGKYLILWTPSFLIAQNNTQVQSGIETTTDNSSYNSRANTFGGGNGTSLTSYGAGAAQILFDVTSTSTHKARFVTGNLNSGSAIRGNTSYNFSEALFLRLGDT